MLGYYIRSWHIVTCNMHKTWELIYLCTMRTLPMSCHVLRMCNDVMRALCSVHPGMPATLCIRGVPGSTYGCAIHAS